MSPMRSVFNDEGFGIHCKRTQAANPDQQKEAPHRSPDRLRPCTGCLFAFSGATVLGFGIRALAIGAYRASDAGSIVGVRCWGLLRQGPSTFGCGFGCEVVSSGLDRCGCELDAEYFSCAGVGVVLVRRRLCILLMRVALNHF